MDYDFGELGSVVGGMVIPGETPGSRTVDGGSAEGRGGGDIGLSGSVMPGGCIVPGLGGSKPSPAGLPLPPVKGNSGGSRSSDISSSSFSSI